MSCPESKTMRTPVPRVATLILSRFVPTVFSLINSEPSILLMSMNMESGRPSRPVAVSCLKSLIGVSACKRISVLLFWLRTTRSCNASIVPEATGEAAVVCSRGKRRTERLFSNLLTLYVCVSASVISNRVIFGFLSFSVVILRVAKLF